MRKYLSCNMKQHMKAFTERQVIFLWLDFTKKDTIAHGKKTALVLIGMIHNEGLGNSANSRTATQRMALWVIMIETRRFKIQESLKSSFEQ